MKIKITNIATLLILFSTMAFSQTAFKKEGNKKTKELKTKAVKLLNETNNEINTLRTIENRISFNSELANLMWYHDADEGRRMFKNITDDFTEIMSRYNADINSFGGVKDESEFFTVMRSPTDKTRAIGRMTKAIGVRRQIALSIAAHDAELGNDFVIRTSQIVTDVTFQKRVEKQNTSLESAIIAYMAGQDIDKALAFARKQLKKNFRRSMLSLLEKVHKKDKDKAKSFASEILDKVKSELREPKSNFKDSYSVLSFGAERIDKEETKKKAIFNESSLRSLADEFANVLISRSEEAEEDYRMDSYISVIEEFSETSADRLERKFKNKDATKVDKAIAKMKDAARDASDKAKDAVKIVGDDADSVRISSSPMDVEIEKERKKAELFEKLKNKKFKELPKEEKQKIIDEAQKIVSSFKEPTEKIAGLSTLAVTVKQLGDEKLASELMNEASLLVNQQPKTYLDYMQVWSLATGYSAVDADKTFPILENAIYQLNDTLEAFVKVGEFIDVGGDLVIDNEVQLGSFGGAMTQSFLGQIGSSAGVIENLAKADFDKTKALADRFSRTELRILVKMMIMRSILDDGKNKISFEDMRDRSMFGF